ncbi:MAG TPA: hypothetical protein VNZ45_04100 [Bacteroidia bacterium]|jgi:hypothetical protein|nr:hypothetical protein [Bacteroidia bacterium]
MDIYEASDKILRRVHYDLEGKLDWPAFIKEQTTGFNDDVANEIRGTYSRALIILTDEGMCRKVPGSDIVELAQKGIEVEGDFKKYLKKKKTTHTLEKLRRIAPIISAIIVIISFIITMMKKNSNKEKVAAQKAQTTVKAKDSRGSSRR